ncbi:MAG: SMP-30/gluconolactonase/LRE family protein [Sinobacteraceae bacterium]|nr:SMP-30/gluconolactonase/LRE family protein [Nevskiaceae bacterium]
MKRSRLIGVTAAVGLGAYLLLWPVPVEPVAWQAAPLPAYVGVHAVNNRLAGLRQISLDGNAGPEHVVIGPDGRLYAAVEAGRILRMNPDGTALEVYAQTGGRVLGIAFDAEGQLYAADALRGLLRVDRTGQVVPVVTHYRNEPIRYADAVVIASDGRVYFSDASTRFAPSEWGGTFEASVLDILEQSSTGRVFEFDPKSGTTRLVARGFSFANGLAITADGRHLLVVETGRYRVWRIAIEARGLDIRVPESRAASSPALATVLLDNLPGFPDNLMRGLDGRIWLGFTKPRSAMVDRMGPYPRLRAMTLRLPRALWPVPPAYGHVIAFTETGQIVRDLQDPTGQYPETTAVTETAERLYVQSLHARTLGWLQQDP